MEVSAQVDQMFARAALHNITDGARHLSIPRIDSSTCFRCGARVGLCSHSPIHQPLPKSADAPASLTKPGDAGSLEEWLA